jgi:SAM-dependent methyltransferase
MGVSASRTGTRRSVDRLALRLRSQMLWREDVRFDARHGIESQASIGLDQLAIESPNAPAGFSYVATPTRIVRAFLEDVAPATRGATFIDFGSGKGRVLMLASLYPFGAVIGVEFAPELHAAAVANVARFDDPARQCRDVRPILADAATFELPEGDCILFFNNPFAEPVMRAVLARVAARVASGQRFHLLYLQLRDEPDSDRTDNLALVRQLPFLVERQARARSVADRVLLGSHVLAVFAPRPWDAAGPPGPEIRAPLL